VRIALALLVMLGACEPDYSETAFLCDQSARCPTGQLCMAGRCRRGGAVGEIACGAGGTCTPEQQCCVDSSNPPRCIPAADVCPNGYGALCDGLADCQLGDACCDGDLTYCRASCATTVCTVDADCPSGEPHCCIDPTVVPWGSCQFYSCTE
jgi:hypothetical protein